jgi:hypothetical protein
MAFASALTAPSLALRAMPGTPQKKPAFRRASLVLLYLVLLKRQEAYILLPKVSWQYEHSCTSHLSVSLLFKKSVNSWSKLPLSELKVSKRYLFSITHLHLIVYYKRNSLRNEVKGGDWRF